MLARFAQCWGSLEASRGGMLKIGAVGSNYVEGFAVIVLFHLQTDT